MMNCYGVLEMRSHASVARDYSPLVGKQAYLWTTHRNHWLNGDAQTILQLLAITTLSVVGHSRIFVHLPADTMADKFLDNSVTMRLSMLLHRAAYIAQPMADNGLLNG